MYTVTITKGVNQSGQRVFSLTYSGERTVTDTFLIDSYVDADHVADVANTRIAGLIKQDNDFDTIQQGSVITPAPLDTTVSQDVLDQQQYFIQLQNLKTAQDELNLGIITQNEFDSQLAVVKNMKNSIFIASPTRI